MRKNFYKNFFTYSLAAMFLLGFAHSASAANVLANPGFENGINAWTVAGAGWQAQSTVVHSGSSAAENTIPSLASAGHYGTLSQTFSATPGTMYYATLYAKSIIAPLSTANAGLQVSFLDSNGTVIDYYQDSIGGTTDWRQLYVAKPAPSGTVQVRFQTYVFAMQGDTLAVGGKAYFDDAVLDTNYIAPPTHPFGLYNPNFENGLHDWWQNGPNWTIETAQPYSGSYSAKNTIGTITGYDYMADLAQDEPVTPGQTVYGTLRVKTAINPASSAQAGVIVDFLNANHQPISGTEVQNVIGGNTPWSLMYVTAVVPSSAAYARFRAFVFANQNDPLAIGGIAYFDEGVFSTTYIAPPNNSQLVNPGFENGLNGWTITEPYVVNGTPATWGLESTAPFAGTYSAKNTINITNLHANATSYYTTASQTLASTPGTTYYATLYAKTAISPASQAQAGLLVEFLGSGGTVLASAQDTIGGNTSWEQLYVSATAPTGTVQVRYSNMVSAAKTDTAAHNGKAYFDEAILSTTYIAPPGGSQLANPGFENGLNGWSVTEAYLTTGAPATWSLETAAPFAGTYSAKNTINITNLDPASTSYYATVSQTFSTTPGTTYYATAQAKTAISSSSQAQAGILIEFLDASSNVISGASGQDTIGGTTNWELLYATAVAPTGAVQVRYSNMVSAAKTDLAAHNGKAYFDANVFGTTYIAPPNNSQLVNPGFENGLNGWSVLEPFLVSGTPATWGLESTVPFVGIYSAKNTINITNLDPTATEYYATASQTLYTTPGTTFYATANAKTAISPTSQAQAGVLIEFLDVNSNVLASSQDTIGGTTSWQQLYLAATAPTGTVQVRYSCMVSASKTDTAAHNGIAYFDENILSTTYIAPPGGSQLVNPGFENGLNGWDITEPYLVSGTPATWGLESATPFAGSYSAKNVINITNLDPAATSYYATSSQTFSVSPGTAYYATLHTKTAINPTSQAQAGLLIEFLDASGNIISGASGQDTVGGAQNWEQLYVAVTAPAGAAQIRYNCMVFASKTDTAAHNGITYFDEAILTTTYIAPPGTSQLVNPGFENGLNGWDILEPYLVSGTPATWGLESAAPYAGVFSSKNTIDITNLDPLATEYYATASQTFDTTPGTTFYATLQATTAINPIAATKAGLLIEFLDVNNTLLPNGAFKDVIGGNTPWRYLYVAATAPTGTMKVRYSCMISGPKDTLAQGGLAKFDSAVFGTTYIAPPSPSLTLLNPDIENGLHDWDVVEPALAGTNPSPTWIAQSAQVYNGVLGAKNTVNMTLQANLDYYAVLSQEIPATPGQPIYATAQTKTSFNVNSGGKAGLRIEFYDSNNTLISYLKNEIGGINSSWYQLIVSVGAAPTGTAKIKYMLYVWANKTDTLANGAIVYFDDAQMNFIYVNHLGYVGGQDTFPQELAQQTYYTGAASVRMAIRYLLGSSKTQNELYNIYHWSGPGNDMNNSEIITAMNTEAGQPTYPYHYGDWWDPAQIDAIKRFVYWVDYLPPGGMYCPAFVPINGTLKWRLVRGISTSAKPHPIGQPMPNFNVNGMWVNDASVSGLGFNLYQTTTAFQVEYLPINGQYTSIYEPPPNLNTALFNQQLARASVSLVPATPSADLMREIRRVREVISRETVNKASAESISSNIKDNSAAVNNPPAAQTQTFVFNKEYLRQALPAALKQDASFMVLFNKPGDIRQYEVTSKDNNTQYTLLALDSATSGAAVAQTGTTLAYRANAVSKTATATKMATATTTTTTTNTKVVIEANPLNGAITEVTWDKNGQAYLNVNQAQAMQLAQNYLANTQAKSGKGYSGNTQAQVVAGTPQLVWSRNFKTSRFQPSWEVTFANKQVVYVNQQGICTPSSGAGTGIAIGEITASDK